MNQSNQRPRNFSDLFKNHSPFQRYSESEQTMNNTNFKNFQSAFDGMKPQLERDGINFIMKSVTLNCQVFHQPAKVAALVFSYREKEDEDLYVGYFLQSPTFISGKSIAERLNLIAEVEQSIDHKVILAAVGEENCKVKLVMTLLDTSLTNGLAQMTAHEIIVKMLTALTQAADEAKWTKQVKFEELTHFIDFSIFRNEGVDLKIISDFLPESRQDILSHPVRADISLKLNFSPRQRNPVSIPIGSAQDYILLEVLGYVDLRPARPESDSQPVWKKPKLKYIPEFVVTDISRGDSPVAPHNSQAICLAALMAKQFMASGDWVKFFESHLGTQAQHDLSALSEYKELPDILDDCMQNGFAISMDSLVNPTQDFDTVILRGVNEHSGVTERLLGQFIDSLFGETGKYRDYGCASFYSVAQPMPSKIEVGACPLGKSMVVDTREFDYLSIKNGPMELVTPEEYLYSFLGDTYGKQGMGQSGYAGHAPWGVSSNEMVLRREWLRALGRLSIQYHNVAARMTFNPEVLQMLDRVVLDSGLRMNYQSLQKYVPSFPEQFVNRTK